MHVEIYDVSYVLVKTVKTQKQIKLKIKIKKKKHVLLLRDKSNFRLCLGILPRRVYLLCQEHTDGTEVLTRNLYVVLIR